MIRVAIADDHPEIRAALRLLLSWSKNIEVACEAHDGREAVECVQHHRPDVLVMAVGMSRLNGFEAAKQVAEMQVATRVILISIFDDEARSEKAAAVGAHGFVPKDELVNFLLPAIEAVHRGELYFPV